MKQEFKYNKDLAFIRNDIKGNLMLDGEYVFQNEKDKLPYQHLLKWMTSRNPQYSEKKKDRFVPDVINNPNFNTTPEDKIVWLGHSSFYIQLNSKRILTDPVFDHPSPIGLRRKHPLPCPITQLNNIDYIILSHGHRDHLDSSTLRKLSRLNPSITIVCPLGFTKLLTTLGFTKIIEMAWWQEFKCESLRFVFLPAKHWNRRFIHDYNKELWGSFGIFSNKSSVYFGGDSGYAEHYKEINEYIPTFDYCLMPIGAYKPRYIMKWAHISPEEAVMATNELKGKNFIPMHYGTFDLSDEPAGEPLRLIKKYKEEAQLDAHLHCLDVGECLFI